MRADEENAKILARQKARERVLADFERAQGAGGGGRRDKSTTPATTGSTTDVSEVTVVKATQNGDGVEGERGVKRKFELDVDEVERVSRESEEAALRQIELEQVRVAVHTWTTLGHLCSNPFFPRPNNARPSCPISGWYGSHTLESSFVGGGSIDTGSLFTQPSLTPDAGPVKLQDIKLKTLCHVGKPTHPIRCVCLACSSDCDCDA
jgi:hypothetical protein